MNSGSLCLSRIIGHETQRSHLASALQDRQISHAYIFEGIRGVQKKDMAFAFAKAIFCEEPVPYGKSGIESCNRCRSCQLFDKGLLPDFTFIGPEPDKKSISKEQIHASLIEDMALRPYDHAYKVYVVDPADSLTAEAQNTLLKTIEEPPAYGVVILLTESASRLLPTVVSRSVILSLSPLPTASVEEALILEGASPEDAALASAFAAGSLGNARALLQDEAFAELRNKVYAYLATLPAKSASALFGLRRIFEAHKDQSERILTLMALYYRDLYLFSVLGDPSQLWNKDLLPVYQNAVSRYTKGRLERALHGIFDARQKLSQNVNPELTLDVLLLNI